MTTTEILVVESGETYTIPAGTTERYLRTVVNGTLDVQGTLITTGDTGGLDLTVETLLFIHDNFESVASNFGRATDNSGNVVWEDPVLRNHVTKSIFPNGETSGYTSKLSRNAYVVTVEEQGRTQDPVGTEFDFDVEAEVDVRLESVNNGFNDEITDSTDWETFQDIIKRTILTNRKFPRTDPNCRFDWRWLSITNESRLPQAENNRDHYGVSLTVTYYGFERLP